MEAEIPPEMKKQADAAASMPGAGFAAAALQNPLIANVASGMSAMAGTPVPPEMIMEGAKVASKHIEKVEAENTAEEGQSKTRRPSMGR